MSCPWPINYFGCAGAATYLAGIDPATKDAAEKLATDFLFRVTGERFGVCDVTVRPCLEPKYSKALGRWLPVIIDGSWYNLSCSSCGTMCGCDSGAAAIDLPGPVNSVISVVIEGTTVPVTAYRLEGNTLYRVDGGTWPLGRDRTVADGEPGTWSITYGRGLEVPAEGEIAAGVLALEMAKALCNDSSCQLPQRVQNISRQGVTTVLLDSFEELSQGRTGLWLVDSWTTSINGNYNKVSSGTGVYTPRKRNSWR